MDYQVTLTVTEHGYNEDNGSIVLDALQEIASGAGPVVSQNLASGLLSATVGVHARDAQEAVDLARGILADALARTRLPMTRLVELDAHAYSESAHAA